MRIAVTGSRGRLGRALISALDAAPFPGPRGPLAWGREQMDLDDPAPVGRHLDADRVELVVHASAWTDVDGCARDPGLALRRNGIATGILADACAARGIDLVLISTNEVFDGRRADRRGYEPGDPVGPINPYGASKLAGEQAAFHAYAAAGAGPVAGHGAGRAAAAGATGGRLGIVRTAWLFGPPGNDFPTKVLAAADRAVSEGTPLRVVGDEVGSPTYSLDVADGIIELIGSGDVSGLHHIVNAGAVSRAGWARELVRRAGLQVEIEEVPAATWPRLSTPPAWAVLEPTALPSGELLRSWQEALGDYMPALLRGRAAAAAP